jgi:hypothetical protein
MSSHPTRKLVIHVGAEKCASTSIQDSLRALCNNDKELFQVKELNPWIIAKIADYRHPSNTQEFRKYADLILQTADTSKDLIISHEVLCRHPKAVGEITEKAFFKQLFGKVIIIGYTRHHSGYFQSSFRQWHFRNRKILAENLALFSDLDLEHLKFSALERYMFGIAWHLISTNPRPLEHSWYSYFNSLNDVLKKFSSQDLFIYSNHIPSRSRPFSILQDFIDHAQLNVPESSISFCENRSNASFYPPMTEAISAILCTKHSNSTMIPDAHSHNDWLFKISKFMGRSQLEAQFFTTSLILSHCSEIIDNCYYHNNLDYCKLMNVDTKAFPELAQISMDRDCLLDIARQTQKERDFERFQHAVLQSIGCFNQAVATVGGPSNKSVQIHAT